MHYDFDSNRSIFMTRVTSSVITEFIQVQVLLLEPTNGPFPIYLLIIDSGGRIQRFLVTILQTAQPNSALYYNNITDIVLTWKIL